MTLRNEWIRKLVHLVCVFIPLGYLKYPKGTMLIVLGCLLAVAGFVEWARFQWERFSSPFLRFLGPLLRLREKNGLTGATTLFLGCFATILFFERIAAVTAIFFLILGDSFSTMVGRKWGKHPMGSRRTLEGCAAFLCVGILVVWFVPDLIRPVGLIGLVVACALDGSWEKMDDNIAIPVGSALVMQASQRIGEALSIMGF